MHNFKKRNKILHSLIIGCFFSSFLFSPLIQALSQEVSTTTDSLATSSIIQAEQEEITMPEASTGTVAEIDQVGINASTSQLVQNENSTSSESTTSTTLENNATNTATTSDATEQSVQEENIEPLENETSTLVAIPSKFKKT